MGPFVQSQGSLDRPLCCSSQTPRHPAGTQAPGRVLSCGPACSARDPLFVEVISTLGVRDPEGRRLRPRPPSWGKAQVKRGHAKWIHAPGFSPDTDRGTIQLLRSVQNPPAEARRADLLDPHGVLLCTLDHSVARTFSTRRSELVTIVGEPCRQGPRCLVLTQALGSGALEALRSSAQGNRRVQAGVDQR